TPSVVAPGGTSVLTWSSINSTSCTASGGWNGQTAISGTQDTGSLSATTSHSLVWTGPAGTGTAATATVTVSNTVMSLVTAAAAITLSQTQQFTATVPGGGSVTYAVDGVANGNAPVGTVSASGL